MDRNYEAIAMLAVAAINTAKHTPVSWENIDPDLRGQVVEAVMTIARNVSRPEGAPEEAIDLPAVVFTDADIRMLENVTCAALIMYGGHGALAIEEVAVLGQFMIDEVGYDPTTSADSIVESAMRWMREKLSQKPSGGTAPDHSWIAQDAYRTGLQIVAQMGPASIDVLFVDAARVAAYILEKAPPITAEEANARGFSADMEGRAIDVIAKLGWPTAENPLGTAPTHRLVEIAKDRTDWPVGETTPLYQLSGVALDEIEAIINGHVEGDNRGIALGYIRAAREERDRASPATAELQPVSIN